PEELFKQYVVLGDNFDIIVAELYSDEAKIFAYRKYPHGLERVMELTGKQWKNLIVKVMPGAKAANDISTYTEVQIDGIKGGYKIRANRYSERKCYLDKGYYMIVKPDENGNLQITEEYSETQPQANC
ncbi:MAG: hypothetical protein QMC38_17800, partial [Sinobacterium sp.]